MKVIQHTKKEAKAFTLIEMIGVLAVIAILAALLIPKIFEAINNARVNNALVSYNTAKAACMDHYAKYGAIDRTVNGASIPPGVAPPVGTPGLAYYDGVLLSEGFLDKPFVVKIGTNSWVQVTTNAANGIVYQLDGITNSVGGSTYIVEAIIQGVPANDAKDVNDRLDSDKPPFNVTLGANDTTGRVKYDATLQQVNIYVTHR